MRIGKFTAFIIALISIAATSSPTPVFFDARLEPPSGRVISGWGHIRESERADLRRLDGYTAAVAPHAPAMISFYVNLDFSTESTFLQQYREFSASHGYFIADIDLIFPGREHDVSIGMRDPDVIALADGLRDVGRPVLIQIGGDFNNSERRYNPSDYIGAFRHAVDRMRKDNLNFASVWDATALGFRDTPNYMKWYPGDDVVDWWGLECLVPEDFSRPQTKAFLEDAERHHKPLILTARAWAVHNPSDGLAWYGATFGFIRANSVIQAFNLGHPTGVMNLWPSVATYLKQQLADPRFIDASEARGMFRPPLSQR